MNILEIKNLSKSFDDIKILENIDIVVKKGEVVAIIGKSGSGKTTLFNILANIEKYEKGEIIKRGKISYMLQKDLLLPYKTAYENLALPLIIQKKSKEEIKSIIMPKLEKFGLKDLENKYPNKLSGGQKQRVALLRTYLFSDEIILLDEAFNSLDYITKLEMYEWFKNLQKSLNLTCLLITHDIEEAIELSDKIYVLNGKPAVISKIFDTKKEVNLKEKIINEIKKIESSRENTTTRFFN